MIKDTTLVTATGFIHDVYWRAQQIGRPAFKNLEALLIATIIYLLVNTLISVSFKVHKFAQGLVAFFFSRQTVPEIQPAFD